MDERVSDSEDQTLTRESLESWTKTELSKWLMEKGLKKGGTKDALINRVCLTFVKRETSSDTILGSGCHTNQKYCCVPLCHNTSQTVLPDGQKVTLHRLPADKKRKRQWIVKLNHVRKNLLLTEGTRVCMVHFENYDTSNIPIIFPTKQPKPRRPLQRITSKATSQTKDMVYVSELPEDANTAAASPVLCAKCHNEITDKADVGTQCTPDTKSAETQQYS